MFSVFIGGFKGGGQFINPPCVKLGGVYPPLILQSYYSKGFWPATAHDHRQVGQAGKNGDAPKEARLNFGQQCIKSLYFKRLKKLN